MSDMTLPPESDQDNESPAPDVADAETGEVLDPETWAEGADGLDVQGAGADYMIDADPAMDAGSWGKLPEEENAPGSDVSPQQTFSEIKIDTPAGSAFLPEHDQPAAFDVPVYPGEYVLDVHGHPSGVVVHDTNLGTHANLGAAEFADVVKNNTGWENDPIRLFSCDTGRDPDGFAQQLADSLDVPVTAPDKAVWSDAGGEPIVATPAWDPVYGVDFPVDPPDGQWITFHPQQKG